MKELLTEVYATTKKISGIDPSKPGNLKAVLIDDAAFEAYVTGLAESIENKKDRGQFIQLAENTRINLLENSMFQINPYETLTLPILRVFYPKLIAKEAVTVSPMRMTGWPNFSMKNLFPLTTPWLSSVTRRWTAPLTSDPQIPQITRMK